MLRNYIMTRDSVNDKPLFITNQTSTIYRGDIRLTPNCKYD
jgi:hypothetical protein